MPWEGNYILAELPVNNISQLGDIDPVTEIIELRAQGYQPVLAHPERYTYLEMDYIRDLKRAGAEFQRNLGALEGFYGEAVSKRAHQIDSEGMYDMEGTDLHNYRYADFFENHVFSKR